MEQEIKETYLITLEHDEWQPSSYRKLFTIRLTEEERDEFPKSYQHQLTMSGTLPNGGKVYARRIQNFESVDEFNKELSQIREREYAIARVSEAEQRIYKNFQEGRYRKCI